MLYILDSMEELKVRLLSEDYGKHLMGVEDLLQKHALVEADINVLGERVKMVVQHSQRFLETEATGGFGPCDPAIIVDRVQQLEVMIYVTKFGNLLTNATVVYVRMPTLNWLNWPWSAVLAWKKAANFGNFTGTWLTKKTGSRKKNTFCRLAILGMI
jgi:hypothetical protein